MQYKHRDQHSNKRISSFPQYCNLLRNLFSKATLWYSSNSLPNDGVFSRPQHATAETLGATLWKQAFDFHHKCSCSISDSKWCTQTRLLPYAIAQNARGCWRSVDKKVHITHAQAEHGEQWACPNQNNNKQKKTCQILFTKFALFFSVHVIQKNHSTLFLLRWGEYPPSKSTCQFSTTRFQSMNFGPRPLSKAQEGDVPLPLYRIWWSHRMLFIEIDNILYCTKHWHHLITPINALTSSRYFLWMFRRALHIPHDIGPARKSQC